MKESYREKLVALLSDSLDFHEQDSGYASHDYHSFPAKFPPQLPRKFIRGLTQPGDLVLDPMVGSGTTLLEAYLSGRLGIGFDIDPLALLLTKVKATSLDMETVSKQGEAVLKRASDALRENPKQIEQNLDSRFNKKTRKFVNYWFARETQIELTALINSIERVENEDIRAFLQLVFSAIVITKSGGVSMAFDLAHTRPHRAKVVYDRSGQVILGHDLVDSNSSRVKLLTKTLRSPIDDFRKRLQKNLESLQKVELSGPKPRISFGDAEDLPLDENSVDLIVTSPPYAANAIDYMRAHKFSLVWLGYLIRDLGKKRKEYIGGEATSGFDFENIPEYSSGIVAEISSVDEKRGQILHRYYSEITRVLREMHRILKPGKAAIVVIGNSTMRGKDTFTEACLADIGRSVGFDIPKIGIRNLDRNRRMMPAGFQPDHESQIEQRMHQEYVIGFYKPE